jgi:T5SS/PEP-CTERM-associated repeat protein
MKKKFIRQLAIKFTKKNIPVLAITALALCASPGSRAAALCGCLRYWCYNGAGDWFTASNWCPNQHCVPGCAGSLCCQIDNGTTEADIDNGGTAKITTGTANACEVFLGKNSGDVGTLSVAGPGTLDQCNAMWVGWDGKGTLSITSGGSVSTDGAAGIGAHASGSTGSATVDGTNSTWTVNGATLYVGGTLNGAAGTGLLTVTNGGTVTTGSDVHVYKSGTLTGNSTVNVNSGSGTVAIDGGTLEPNWTLTVNGNLRFVSNTNATMQCSVIPSNTGNDAEVTGTANLDDKLLVTMTGNFTPGTTYTLLYADTALNGTFSGGVSINYPTCECFKPVIQYDAHSVKLYLSPVACCTE